LVRIETILQATYPGSGCPVFSDVVLLQC